MLKKHIKSIATASAFFSLIAFPMTVATVEAASVSMDRIFYEVDGNKFSITYQEFAFAQLDENNLYDLIKDSQPLIIQVDTGESVRYADVGLAILDNPGKSPSEILTEISSNPAYQLDENVTGQYTDLVVDGQGNPIIDKSEEAGDFEIIDIY